MTQREKACRAGAIVCLVILVVVLAMVIHGECQVPL